MTTAEQQSALSPQEALNLLKEGNQRFVSGTSSQGNLMDQVHGTEGGQNPFAAVLTCIDSRTPAEMIFDQGIGDIFTARVAGNFVNTDILGSLEFACKVAGSKVIVIMGHTSCGAIKGAISDVELGNLTSMLDNLKPAVQQASGDGDRTADNPAFVDAVVDKNVELTVQNLLDRSPVLKEMVDAGEISVVGCVYDVATGNVSF